MRWALVRVTLTVSTLVVLSFAVPLGLVVKQVARDRAFEDAERQATTIGPALAVTTTPAEVARAVSATEAGAGGRIAVFLLPEPAGSPQPGAPQPGAPRPGSPEPGSPEPGSGTPGQPQPPPPYSSPPHSPQPSRGEIGEPAWLDALEDSVAPGVHRSTARELQDAARLGRGTVSEVRGGYALLHPTTVAAGRIAVVEVFVPDAEVSRGVTTSWLILAGVGLALITGSVVTAERLGSRLVRPARRLASAAHALGEGELDARVPVEGPSPELRSAALAFNAMADRVRQLLAEERELAADLSHRLRTPLTVLRLNAASLGDGDSAEQTRTAVAQLEREVDQIIRTVRERSAPSAAGPSGGAICDVAAVVRERLAFWSALAEDQGREVSASGLAEPVRAPVPRADLVAALDAMLGNVFRHTPEGTALAVDVHQGGAYRAGAGRGADSAIILVSDAGPGIADPQAALRRGWGDGGPGSTGLGLDIVRRVAESTGGEVRIGSSALGGTEVRVLLGRAERPPERGRLTRRRLTGRRPRRERGRGKERGRDPRHDRG